MKNTTAIAIVVAAVLIGGGIFLVATDSTISDDAKVKVGASASPQATANPNAVTISNFAFSPTPLKVRKGTTVTWTNQDSVKHTVTVDSGQPAGGPDSSLFGKNESFSFTFNTVGTYNYHCSAHPYMHGVVEVTK